MTATAWLLPDLGLFVSELREVVSDWPTRVELASGGSPEALDAVAEAARELDALAASIVSEPDDPSRDLSAQSSRLLADLLVPAAAAFSAKEPPAIALGLAIPASRAARVGWPLLEWRTTGVHLRVLPSPEGPPPLMDTRFAPLAGALRAAALMADDPVAAGVLVVVEQSRPTLYDQEAVDLARRRLG
jgi:hypothetical protein